MRIHMIPGGCRADFTLILMMMRTRPFNAGKLFLLFGFELEFAVLNLCHIGDGLD
jgi:hypothetical protein